MSPDVRGSDVVLTPPDYLNPVWPDDREFDKDWRVYIGGDLIEIWDTFTPLQKKLLAENAQRIVDDEDYDGDE